MNQTLRPQPQLAEVLPGALSLALLLLLVFDHTPNAFDYLSAPSTGPGALALYGAAFLFAAWIFGTLLDTIRNGVVEEVVDWFSKRPLNWEFFVRGDRDKVTQLDEYFFAYYQAKANYAIGATIFIVVCLFWFPTGTVARIAFFPAAPLITFFCAIDSRSLRREIKELAEEPPHAPVHAGVYTRLQKSTHGIGVFAIRDIPAENERVRGRHE
jgi:hypothetical protein